MSAWGARAARLGGGGSHTVSAGGGIRTPKPLRAAVLKTAVYPSSTTPAEPRNPTGAHAHPRARLQAGLQKLAKSIPCDTYVHRLLSHAWGQGEG